jgi:molecular chaperone HscB
VDPFALLGIEPTFDLDLKSLSERHREISSTLHPDRHVGSPSGERRAALDRAIQVNEAWRKLKAPLSRGEELLRLMGVAMDEKNAPKADPELLFQVMEAREELAELRATPNTQSLQASIAKATAWQRSLVNDLSQLFKGLQENARDPQGLLQVQSKLVELRYCERLLEEAHNLEHDAP